MDIIALKGKESIPYLNDVARLRIAIFQEWPYLYDGSMEHEKEYLRVYANSGESLLILAKQDEQVVGAVTGVPLESAMQEIKKVFEKEQIPMQGIFYLGEILLLKEFRGKKTGLKMYQLFESLVREKKKYKAISLCEIKRADDDPRKPAAYRSLDSFWSRLGYMKDLRVVASFSYKEVDSDKGSAHPMAFSQKVL